MNKNFLLAMLLGLLGASSTVLYAVEDFDQRCEAILNKARAEIWRCIRLNNCSNREKFVQAMVPHIYGHCSPEQNSLIQDLYKEKIVYAFNGNDALIGAAFLSQYGNLCPTQNKKLWKNFSSQQQKHAERLFSASYERVHEAIGGLFFQELLLVQSLSPANLE